MRAFVLAAALAAFGVSQSVQAQNPFISKPIDTNKLLVKPTDAMAGAAAGTSTGIFRTATRTIAGAIEGNGFVKTINNLLGRRAKNPTPQAGYSALPQPGSYASTGYGTLSPAMPVAAPYGKSPNVVLPASPSAQR